MDGFAEWFSLSSSAARRCYNYRGRTNNRLGVNINEFNCDRDSRFHRSRCSSFVFYINYPQFDWTVFPAVNGGRFPLRAFVSRVLCCGQNNLLTGKHRYPLVAAQFIPKETTHNTISTHALHISLICRWFSDKGVMTHGTIFVGPPKNQKQI